MPLKYIKKILTAQIYHVAIETPIDYMHFMSKRLNNKIYVKREDLQPVFSFKLRGALNKLSTLTPTERKRGVIAASAGNHAQGVAVGAKRMNIEAIIVMPKTTPEIKVQSVREHGAKVVLHGECFDQACVYAKQLAKENNYVFIHPYDDPSVIAGQGTIAMEILRQHNKPLDAIFVPVGGGGLIAGIAIYIKYIRPEIQIIAVEAEDSACLKAALEAKKRVILPKVGIFADGVAVAQIGKEPFRLARQYVDQVITVSTDQICASIKDLFEDNRSIAEPAGALALAGIKKYIQENNIKNHHYMAIESGANVNFKRLRYISQRTDLGEKKEVLIATTLPEKPGSLKGFYNCLHHHDITEFNYRYNDSQQASILVGIDISKDADHFTQTIQNLNKRGYPITDLSNNELAKEHICHMIGGAGPAIESERIFRFEFPECPGALQKFLTKLPATWNISMFQYRKQGGTYGQVLIGLQIPKQENHLVQNFAEQLNYQYVEETNNSAYKLFLTKQTK